MDELVAFPESPVDPDAAAVPREFIDFTEYLPADMFRSMQLIRQLNQKAEESSQRVDSLTREFANLPEQMRAFTPHDGDSSEFVAPTVSDREMELRLNISRAINATLAARKEAAAEAQRLKENMSRHHARIIAIRDKLNQITIPQREPTPESPQKLRTGDVDIRKIKLRLTSEKPGSAGRRGRGGTFATAHTPRSRHAQAIDDKDDDGWEDIPQSPRHYDKVIKKKKYLGFPKRGPKPPSDPPFVGGAASRYDDGTLIPNHLLPWNRLTNEELAKLRKRMKKNSGWTPSVTMIIRELEGLGRGPKNRERFEDQWGGSRGEEFLKIYGPEDGGIGDPEMITPDDGAGVRENKGMRLNRAKKRKREEERREKEREAERERQAADQEQEKLRIKHEEELRARREREEKEREEAEREKVAAAAALAKEKEAKERAAREKAIKERERAAANAAPPKSTRSASTSTTKTAITADEDEVMHDAEEPRPPPVPVPIKPRLGRPPKHPPPLVTSPPSSGEKRKRAPSTTIPPTPSLAETRSKRGESAAAPPLATVSLAVGRKRANSTTAGHKPSHKATKPGNTKKKGLMGGNNRRRGSDNTATEGAGDWVDDEEEEDLNKYCLCNEVSRGTMVLCENEQCSKRWFHIECVGLSEEEAKNETLKWFCPNCEGKRGGKRRRKA